jgi:hypothetical protein
MKNDIKQIKNEISNTQTQKQAKEQKKAHQKALKENLTTICVEFLEYKGKNLLYLLENKHKIIIKAIKRTRESEQLQKEDSDFKEFDKLPGTDKFTLNDKKSDEKEAEDYNCLYDIFFSIYSKLKREEKEKEKLQKEETERKLHKIITNKIEFYADEAKKQSTLAKKYLIAAYKYNELKESIINEILELDPDIEKMQISSVYDKVLKELLNKYKYTGESEPKQQKPIKLHWVWKANFVLDAINALFKHF